MDVILEYMSANYTWILIGSIIILLAIIGWYADKTNFGQGKTGIEKDDNENMSINELKKELGNKKLLDEVNGVHPEQTSKDIVNSNNRTNDSTVVTNSNVVQSTEFTEQPQTIKMNFDPMTGEPLNNNVASNILTNNTAETHENIESIEKINTPVVEQQISDNEIKQPDVIFDDELDNFEKEFNEIIPEREIIDEGLLEDIENLTFDKTQKIDLSDLPDLDDLELPRIKQMKTNDEGVWKF